MYSRGRVFLHGFFGLLFCLGLFSCGKDGQQTELIYVPKNTTWLVHASVARFLKNAYGKEFMSSLRGKIQALKQWNKAGATCIDFEKDVQTFLIAGNGAGQYLIQLTGHFDHQAILSCFAAPKSLSPKQLSSGLTIYEFPVALGLLGDVALLVSGKKTESQFSQKFFVVSKEWSTEVLELLDKKDKPSLMENPKFRSALLDEKSEQNEFFSAMFDGTLARQIFYNSVWGALGQAFSEAENVSMRLFGIAETRFRFVAMYGSNTKQAQDVKGRLDLWQKEIWVPMPSIELSFLRKQLKIALNGSTLVGESPVLSSELMPWHLYLQHL